MTTLEELLPLIFSEIISPVIALLFALAVLIFFWGIAEFVRDADSDEGRNKGKRNIIWGIVGMFIMLSVFGIIRVVNNTIPESSLGDSELPLDI